MNNTHSPWPALSYPDFAPTQQLLHMGLQAIGKLKLNQPFQAQWSQVPLWLNARGLTTGAIPYAGGVYEITLDFIAHQVICATSRGFSGQFALKPMSVTGFVAALFDLLKQANVNTSINQKPQEVPDAVLFDQDSEIRPYEAALVTDWWRILLSVQRVLDQFQSPFQGKIQPTGLMWGTFDIRAVRYNGTPFAPAENVGLIYRNAMNAELFEVGWWPGSATYPKPAFYAFMYPQPKGIENSVPANGRWDKTMGEFLLDYDDLRKSNDPDADLLTFFQSAYNACAKCADWDATLIGSGKAE